MAKKKGKRGRRGPSVTEMRARKKARKEAEMLRRRLRDMKRDIDEARGWPLHACRISSNWREAGLCSVMVTRNRPDGGGYFAALFLVDLGCFGIKSTHLQLFQGEEEYQEMIADHGGSDFEVCEPGLARRVVESAHAYAASFELDQAPEYETLTGLFGDIEADEGVEVEHGYEGKPLVIPGPYDDPMELIEIMTEKVGADGFVYMGAIDVD